MLKEQGQVCIPSCSVTNNFIAPAYVKGAPHGSMEEHTLLGLANLESLQIDLSDRANGLCCSNQKLGTE